MAKKDHAVNGRYRGVNELGKDLALDAFPFLKACLKIIYRDDWIGYKVNIRISRIYDRPRYLFLNVTYKITPQLVTFEKNNHILGQRMIRSGTIKNNSDEMCEFMPWSRTHTWKSQMRKQTSKTESTWKTVKNNVFFINVMVKGQQSKSTAAVNSQTADMALMH